MLLLVSVKESYQFQRQRYFFIYLLQFFQQKIMKFYRSDNFNRRYEK